MSTEEKGIKCVKVTNRLAERTGKFAKVGIGEVKYFGEGLKRTGEKKNPESWKRNIGNQGYMTEEDLEKGNYAPYGIDPKEVEGNKELQSLKDTNKDLQKKVAELEAQLAAKEETKTTKKETTK
jgi:hypothetical protein